MVSNEGLWRWIVLSSYCFITAASQMIWLEFSGIAVPQMVLIFHVNLLMIGLMVSIWPLLSIPLAPISGIFADRFGYKFTITLGGSIITFFSWLRLLAGKDFTLLLIFQSLAGVGQTFIYNSVTKLVSEWFPQHEQAVANGIGTMSEIAGMALALIISPLLTPSSSYSYLFINMITYSSIATVSLIAFVLIINRARAPQNYSGASISLNNVIGILRIRSIIILMIITFIGTGIFASLTQWIEPILYLRDVPQIYSDLAGMVMLISGSIGMVALPYISDRIRTRKKLFIINTAILSALLLLFSIRLPNPILYFTLLIPTGFFLLSLAPLALQLSLDIVGPTRIGTATGLLGLMAEAGAFLMIVIIGEIYDITKNLFSSNQWFAAILTLSVLSLVISLLSLTIKETITSA
ncbi:MAG: MFS transporter [Vulcanisaeta sp.]